MAFPNVGALCFRGESPLVPHEETPRLPVHWLLAPVPKRRRAPNAGAMAVQWRFPTQARAPFLRGASYCTVINSTPTCLYKLGPHAHMAATPPCVKKAKHRPSHAHLISPRPSMYPPPCTMPRRLKTTWAKLNPSSSCRPLTPPTPLSESNLEVNLEDNPDRETASEEEPEPLPVEEVIFNSLETARKEEEDRHLHAIT